MCDVSKAYAPLVAVGILFSASLCALSAHSMLAWLQLAGLLSGDYGSHEHGSLGPVAVGLLVAGAASLSLYLIHTIDSGTQSLPTLARAFRKRLDWRAVVLVAIAGGIVLIAMETGEQLYAHHFDGILSALGGQPALAFGLILALSATIVFAQRNVCTWLIGAHVRIVLAIFTLLDAHEKPTPVAFARSARPRGRRFTYACEAPQIFGKRAPPAYLAS